jgi:hypothetical protein
MYYLLIWSALPKQEIKSWPLKNFNQWEILKGFPTITAAQLYDALSYYYDHKDEIEEFIEANERAYDELLTVAEKMFAFFAHIPLVRD